MWWEPARKTYKPIREISRCLEPTCLRYRKPSQNARMLPRRRGYADLRSVPDGPKNGIG